MRVLGISSLNLTPSTCGIITLIATVLIWWFWNALNWMWLRPNRIERRLKEQGIQGNSYCPLVGDIRDMIKIIKEAKSKPMAPHSNDIAPRVLPYVVHTIAKYDESLTYHMNSDTTLFFM
ncbi:hypothetical protein PHAVU_004G076200 [Phaseolus vulgaris]|uniref:Cytochrome P450 n=1 Tax=Phaseolus vulgaris TaxID=3885 RepID=V7C349_PHAVU|nr:hypothetical protein PHAVU_004G076200g [Phaseolus vulgaris]ESW23798.1 hypothetical protein PHAVU_004G076200g [Phaseolus vulgaris]